MEKNNSQSGFTLIEVLVAIGVLTIGILGAASMQISSLGGNSFAMRITSAATWAGDTQERLMALPYNDPLLSDDSGGHDLASLNEIATADSLVVGGVPDPQDVHGNYTVYWNVVDNYPILNCKTIRVIVSRNDKGTVTQDFTKMREI